jgi:hypothetical protein
VGLRKPCKNSNMHQGHGILGLTYTCRAWDSPRVRKILTCTSYLLGLIDSCWCFFLYDLFLMAIEELISWCNEDFSTNI